MVTWLSSAGMCDWKATIKHPSAARLEKAKRGQNEKSDEYVSRSSDYKHPPLRQQFFTQI